MFPGVPPGLFREHSYRHGLHRLGEVPASFVRRVTEGRLDFPVPCDVNRLLVEGRWDGIISIGQLVPHEVAGISNHNKNVYVGAGGRETINKTHFIGAVHGMERIMGRERSPVREVFDYADAHLARCAARRHLPSHRGGAPDARETAGHARASSAGEGNACFRCCGARLCREVNVEPPRSARAEVRVGLARSRRVPVHVARQQGHLPDPHGHGGRRGDRRARPRRPALRRRSRDRPADPQRTATAGRRARWKPWRRTPSSPATWRPRRT